MCPVSADSRVIRTRNRLRGALLDLLRTRTWDDITVAEVVAHARCSRSTFYAHYDDREALLADAFLGAMAIVPPSGNDHCLAFVPALFEHLDYHRVLAEPYLVEGHGGPMATAFRERIHTHIRERLDATAAGLSDSQRGELAAATAGAVWAALLWWLEYGPDVPPEEASTDVVRLLSPGLSRLTQQPVGR
jgi:AcrR family transcriptional regulator